MGKGIAAALIGAGIKNVYRKVFAELLTVEERAGIPAVDTIVNAIHAEVTEKLIAVGAFVTVSLLRFDLKAQTVTWVNAGHTPTLIASSDGAEIRELLGDNMPLGVIENEVYTQHVTPFSTDDLLLIYSDGVSESLDASNVEYGIDRIKAVLRFARQCGMSPEQALNALREDLHQFTGGSRAADDRTIVLVTPCKQ